MMISDRSGTRSRSTTRGSGRRRWGSCSFWSCCARVARSARAVEPLARHLADLDGAVRALNDGQQQLHGGVTHVAEAQAAAQARLAQAMEAGSAR